MTPPSAATGVRSPTAPALNSNTTNRWSNNWADGKLCFIRYCIFKVNNNIYAKNNLDWNKKSLHLTIRVDVRTLRIRIIKKAFDLVDHKILLLKLKLYHFTDKSIKFFRIVSKQQKTEDKIQEFTLLITQYHWYI